MSGRPRNYLLAVKAPAIGMQILAHGSWVIMERAVVETEIKAKFERARDFLGERGEIVVFSQVPGDAADVGIHLRHRISEPVGIGDPYPAPMDVKLAFWAAAERALSRQPPVATGAVPAAATASRAGGAPALPGRRSRAPWVRIWCGATAAAGLCYVLTLPKVWPVTAFFVQATINVLS